MTNERKVFTTKQVSEFFHVKEYTVRKWIRQEKIKATKVGRRWLITEEEVERVIKEGI